MILSTHTHSVKDSGAEHILVLAFLLLGLRFLYAFCEKFLSKLIKITFSIWITFYEFVHKITATLDSCPGPAAVPAAIPSPGPAQTTPDDTLQLPSLAAFLCSGISAAAAPKFRRCQPHSYAAATLGLSVRLSLLKMWKISICYARNTRRKGKRNEANCGEIPLSLWRKWN